MIPNEFIDSLGLKEAQADAIKKSLKKDSFYRQILCKIGIMPSAIESIMKATDTTQIQLDEEDILAEKARVEWAGLICERRNTK